MLGRIRSGKPYPADDDDEPSINGVGSLLGGDGGGISLDGESVILPGEYDDMSSINNDSMVDAQATAFRIVGKEDTTITGGEGGDLPITALGDNDDDDDSSAGGAAAACLPLWLTDAPSWLKTAIVVSTALLIGAIVLVAVAAALSGVNSGTSSRTIEGTFNEGLPMTDIPTPLPTLPPTLSPTPLPTVTHAPTFRGETPTPSASPTAFPSDKPSSPPTPTPSVAPTVTPSRAPSPGPTVTVSEGPTVQDTASPTVEATDAPTVADTASPTRPPTDAPIAPVPAPVSIAPVIAPIVSALPDDPTDAPVVPPTDAPVAPPTESPVVPPTESPVVPPTDAPVVPPTDAPVVPPTDAPVVPPTDAPIDPPTDAPVVPPTDAPVVPPTDAPIDPTLPPVTVPTWPPQPPITGSTTVFYLTAHRPRGANLADFERNLPLLPTEADFMVHMGDWNSPLLTDCDEESFMEVDELYSTSAVPVYFTVGDNEYNDCPNFPDSMELWYQYILNYETKYWAPPRWNVRRQAPNYRENFSFVLRNILYVAINLVGGEIKDQDEWDDRSKANLKWIDDEFKQNDDVTVMVLLMHSDPDLLVNRDFFDDLFKNLEKYNTPTMLVHRNLGIESGGLEENYNDVSNLVVLIAEGGIWPPMRVEIDSTTGTFTWNQGDWFDNAVN